MTPAEFVSWAEQQEAAGVKDGMGNPFTSWLIAVKNTDGTLARDKYHHQVFQTQTEFKRLRACEFGKTMELFA